MFDQKTVETNGYHPAQSLRRNVFGLVSDLIELSELQFQLLQVDLADSKKSLVSPAMLLIAGGCLFAAAVPVLLVSAGFALAGASGLSLAAAFAIVATASLIVAALLAYFGLKQAQSGLKPLDRSKQELKDNVAWIKAALSDTDPPGRGRYQPRSVRTYPHAK